MRLWGIGWGLPSRTDLHPDETDYVVGHALNVDLRHPDTGFLNYPSFLCCSTLLLHHALHGFGGRRPEWTAYLAGRLISATYGTLTAWIAFLLARRLGGAVRAALLAALWVALLPLNVWDSHVAVTDVMMTFWIGATLVAAMDLRVRPTQGRAAMAGLCLGLATGSKYTAGLVCLAPAVAGASLAACFAVTPFSFIRLGDTLKAMAYENAHTHGHHLGFSVPAHGFQYHRFDAPYLHRDFYGRLDPMFRSYFVSPTIEIYRHRADPGPLPPP